MCVGPEGLGLGMLQGVFLDFNGCIVETGALKGTVAAFGEEGWLDVGEVIGGLNILSEINLFPRDPA